MELGGMLMNLILLHEPLNTCSYFKQNDFLSSWTSLFKTAKYATTFLSLPTPIRPHNYINTTTNQSMAYWRNICVLTQTFNSARYDLDGIFWGMRKHL